ncbi:uncharacterized protein LOC142163089 [Nicotiana tabacum]|uniref:Uncharacterized protein LOC142163089 n=1 Tax=Nicotiana tabacum TaxID=4097 RepID=A0AC58RUM2_TOBAC
MAISENLTENKNNGDNTSIGAIPSSIALDHNHPLYMHASNGLGSMPVGLILTGMKNCSLWSRVMKVALLGKNKLCLVDGSTSKEDFGPSLGSQWDRCNAIVTSWLMSNVSRDLVIGVLFSSNAQKEISSVSTYFTKLKDLWAEYDSILPPPPSATKYIDQLEYQRLLQLLMRLNYSFDQARSQILLMPTLPSIDKAYAMTWHLKENCYKIIGYPSDFKQKKKANAVMIDAVGQQ